jgi:hypothetical protein
MSRRQEIARERARREAALAADCGAPEALVVNDPAVSPDPVGQGSDDAPSLDFQRFRARRVRARIGALLEDLEIAIGRRDLQAVWDVLDEATSMRCFPPGVREEALMIARMPKDSHRAPIKLYRFHEQLQRLDDEPLEWGDPQQLDLPISGDVIRAGWSATDRPGRRSGRR